VRVIAGKFRSRRLQSLPGVDLRPTSDRLRETLFNVLSAGNPAAFDNTVWLDLCAGTGAVGIEALSRGAKRVYFVESSSPAAALIQRNLDSLGVEIGSELLREDITVALTRLATSKLAADFIFLDPPYRMHALYGQILEQLANSSITGPGTIVVAEHEKRFDPGDGPASLRRYRTLKQGDAALSFYRQR
jgi:16S rRNA (guanine966-N2)-methyltransferase